MSGAILLGQATAYAGWEPDDRPDDPAVIDSCEDCAHPLAAHSITVLDLEGRLVVATVCHAPVASVGPGSLPCSKSRSCAQNPSGACGVLGA